MPDYSKLPKTTLHDHLDGGLRPETVLELAAAIGKEDLPGTTADELREWFHQSGSASLEVYLEAFSHTYGVMQTPEAMARVAYEAIEDLAAHGVVYAELRFAPSLHRELGMSRHDAIAGVLDGFARAEADFGVPGRIIVDALRQDDDSVEVARAAVDFLGKGVVGFDLAGPEAGYPATDYVEACAVAVEGGLHLTIHAGEGDGVESIAGALSVGAERLAHGARLIEDMVVVDEEIVEMGPVATEAYERGIPLDMCPKSNTDTNMYPTVAEHPVGTMLRAGFSVNINCDNRLMSATSPTMEFELLADQQGFGLEEFEKVTRNGVAAAFCDEETRALVSAAVDAGY